MISIEAAIKEAIDKVIEEYKQMGAIVEECSLNIADYALATY